MACAPLPLSSDSALAVNEPALCALVGGPGRRSAERAAQEKARTKSRAFVVSIGADLVVHTAHTAHTTARHSRSPAVLLRPFGDHGFRGDQKPGDRRCVLQGRPNNLGRVDDALGDEVHVFAVLGVEAEAILILFQDLADDDGAVLACVNRDLASRPGERLAHDVDAGLLVVVLRAHAL